MNKTKKKKIDLLFNFFFFETDAVVPIDIAKINKKKSGTFGRRSRSRVAFVTSGPKKKKNKQTEQNKNAPKPNKKNPKLYIVIPFFQSLFFFFFNGIHLHQIGKDSKFDWIQ